jgi:hypothetical protein
MDGYFVVKQVKSRKDFDSILNALYGNRMAYFMCTDKRASVSFDIINNYRKVVTDELAKTVDTLIAERLMVKVLINEEHGTPIICDVCNRLGFTMEED